MFHRLTQKQSLDKWQEFAKNIKKATPVDYSETPKQKADRIERLEKDGNDEEWFKYYFPHYYYSEPAPFHKRATKRVIYNPEFYEVRPWSRELAKSARTMMEVLKLVKTKKKSNVLLVSNNKDNAEELLAPYKLELEVNQRLINDYGIQVGASVWTSNKFITRDGDSFRAIGAGQSPRGSRNEEKRPDVILVDDIDTDQDCRNEEMIKQRWNWIEQALIGTRSISNPLLVIFCGNIIADYSCITEAIKKADYAEVINIRDKNGKSTWPAKNTEEMIDRVLSKISYASAQKEYFNNPIKEGTVFKEMAYKPARPLREYSLLVCYTDPSFKDSKKNDFKATVLVGKWKDEYHVIKAFVDQTTTAKMIDWHYHIYDFVKGFTCYFFIEQVFLQDVFIKEFYEAGKAKGATIPIAGDERNKGDKYTRIESLLEPLHRNGKLFLNEREKATNGMKTLEDQFLAFAPGSRAHDDAPDAVEGGIWVLNTKMVATAATHLQVFDRGRNTKRL